MKTTTRLVISAILIAAALLVISAVRGLRGQPMSFEWLSALFASPGAAVTLALVIVAALAATLSTFRGRRLVAAVRKLTTDTVFLVRAVQTEGESVGPYYRALSVNSRGATLWTEDSRESSTHFSPISSAALLGQSRRIEVRSAAHVVSFELVSSNWILPFAASVRHREEVIRLMGGHKASSPGKGG